jgi:hypothetical protein
VQFGLLVSNDDPPEVDPRRRVAEHPERALAARDAGFDTLAVAHRSAYGPARAHRRAGPLPDEVLGNGRWIIGGPRGRIERIEVMREVWGVNHPICAMPWPGMARAQRLRTIELLGEQVLPALRAPAGAG